MGLRSECFIRVMVSIAAALLIVGSVTAGQGSKYPKLGGIRAGFLGGGDLKIGEGRKGLYKTQDAFTVGVFYDWQVTKGLFFSFTGDIYKVKMDTANEDLLLSGSLGIKTEFAGPDGRLALRPGIAMGYGFMKKFYGLKNAKYVTVTTGLDIIFFLAENFGLKGDFGWIWAVDGGDGTVTITGGPMLLMRLGVVNTSGKTKRGRH